MKQSISFRASIAPIMSGIRIGADMMRLQLDIPKSDIQDAVPLLALTDTALRITVEVDNTPFATKNAQGALESQETGKEKPAKRQKPKGPHSLFWQELFKHGFTNEPNVRQWIDKHKSDGQTDKEILRWLLNVESLTFASPDDLVTALKASGFAVGNAIKMVTAAEEKTEKGKD